MKSLSNECPTIMVSGPINVSNALRIPCKSKTALSIEVMPENLGGGYKFSLVLGADARSPTVYSNLYRGGESASVNRPIEPAGGTYRTSTPASGRTSSSKTDVPLLSTMDTRATVRP